MMSRQRSLEIGIVVAIAAIVTMLGAAQINRAAADVARRHTIETQAHIIAIQDSTIADYRAALTQQLADGAVTDSMRRAWRATAERCVTLLQQRR